jgi:hypothetical protein
VPEGDQAWRLHIAMDFFGAVGDGAPGGFDVFSEAGRGIAAGEDCEGGDGKGGAGENSDDVLHGGEFTEKLKI